VDGAQFNIAAFQQPADMIPVTAVATDNQQGFTGCNGARYPDIQGFYVSEVGVPVGAGMWPGEDDTGLGSEFGK
jgi:hypothetical protein